jgi:hypothetical protein
MRARTDRGLKTKEKGSKTGSGRESNTEGVGRNGELEGRKDNLI